MQCEFIYFCDGVARALPAIEKKKEMGKIVSDFRSSITVLRRKPKRIEKKNRADTSEM